MQPIVVITTTGSEEDACRMARLLVERRLAACVHVSGPVTSVYRWRGAIETDREWQCWIKTTRQRYAELEQTIRQNHSYETPEILALPVEQGSRDYLDWMQNAVESE